MILQEESPEEPQIYRCHDTYMIYASLSIIIKFLYQNLIYLVHKDIEHILVITIIYMIQLN
jgi:hypothetical protein